jgi:hypothetical protein
MPQAAASLPQPHSRAAAAPAPVAGRGAVQQQQQQQGISAELLEADVAAGVVRFQRLSRGGDPATQ